MNSRIKKGMGRNNIMGNSAEYGNKAVKDLFEKLEPFFNGILVEMKTFGLADRTRFTQLFTALNAHTQSNIYDELITTFKKRIHKGFDESIRYLKNFPYDENFPKHIKQELDKFVYAKQAIISLFKSLTYGAATGSGMTIERIVKDYWDTDYLEQLNEKLNLTKELTTIFSTSRRNGNTQTVLPVKTILKYYEDNDNSPANTSGKRLIPEFKRKFKENAIDDYKKLQVDYMTGGIHLFLKNSLKFITDEDYRLENALIDDISNELKPILIKEYINVAHDTVLESYAKIIEKNDDEEFQAIVKLFERVDKVKPFAKKTAEAFVLRCQKRISDEIVKVNELISKNNSKIPIVPLHTNAEASMNLFIEFYDQYIHLRDVSFIKNFDFSQQLHNAVETILTTNDLITQTGEGENFIPKLLAAYMNKLLRKGSKVEVEGKTKEEIIKTVCAILEFIRGKDVFLKQYMKNLQDRLIYSFVESNDFELAAINNIEKVCERSEVDRLHKTFTAYDSSNQENERFKNYCVTKKIALPKIDFSCMVFSMTSGDSGSTVDKFNNFKHNEHCMTLFNAYKDFYLGGGAASENTKKLTLDTGRSWGTIQFAWMKRKIEVTVKYPQMVILMLFNEKKQMTFAELGTLTGMEPDILGYFLSGIVSKTLISCSTPNEFLPESEFKFNMTFKPKTTKINVMQPDKKYSEKEDKENNEKQQQEIDEGRSFTIQARQVRIMKQRRTMKYVDLINETVESLRKKFNVSSRMARKQIEFLINKEYFKRSEQDREVLEYMA